MAAPASFPRLAQATVKYKSPHKQDLNFTKGERIRVVSLAPEAHDEEQDQDQEDEDDVWYIGQSLDGARKGTFPGNFVTFLDEVEPLQQSTTSAAPLVAADTLTDQASAQQGPDVQEEKAVDSPVATQDADKVTPPAVAPAAEVTKTSTQATPAIDAAAAHVGVAESSGPETEVPPSVPSASPPIVSSNKPTVPGKLVGTSLKDRIAAFSRSGADSGGAPPPIAPKPAGLGGWKRPPPPPTGDKPLLPKPAGFSAGASGGPAGIRQFGAGAAAAKSPPLNAAAEPTSPSAETPAGRGSGGGFSAADAKNQIKMSLKDRMAALQRGNSGSDPAESTGGASGGAVAEGTSAERSKSPPALAPKPAPGKLSADRRTAALAGMGIGLGAGAVVEQQKGTTTNDTEADANAEADATSAITEPVDVEDEIDAVTEEGVVGEDATAAVDAEKIPASEVAAAAAPAKQPSADEEEAARRAAIAQRLAKLGGQRLGGGGPLMFGAPPPPKPPSKSSASTEGTTQEIGVLDDEAGAPLQKTTSPQPTLDLAPPPAAAAPNAVETASTLAVPKRAAPPRRKKSSARISDTPKSEPVAADAEAALPSPTDDAQALNDEPAEIPDETQNGALASAAPGLGAAAIAGLGVESERRGSALTDDSLDASITPVSDANISEHHKQLEEFIKGSGLPAEADTETNPAKEPSEWAVGEEAAEAEDRMPAEVPERQASVVRGSSISESPRITPGIDRSGSLRSISSVTGGLDGPPSRPGSVRPPIPRTIASPPPVADASAAAETIARSGTTSPPPPKRSVPTPGPPRSPPPSVPEQAEQEAPQSIETALGAPALAVPKPRLAVPADDDEFDDEPSAEQEPQIEPEGAEASVPVQESEQPPAELTQEEEEAQRRARIAQRMARLGGQKIGAGLPMGIMGAPMPPRRSVPTPGAEEEPAAALNDLEQMEMAPVPVPAASPPPPPAPARALPPVAPAPVAEAEEVQETSEAEEDDAVAVIPAAAPERSPPRQPTNDVEHLTLAPVDPAATILSPPLPTSPTQAPFLPPKSPSRSAPPVDFPPAPAKVPSAGASSDFRSSSRDLDLMPGSRWWRQGTNPLRLPLTVSGRPDAIMYADQGTQTKRGKTRHSAEIHVLFEDYSQTVIELEFEEDDAEEAKTSLTQRHLFPPGKPSQEQLTKWAASYGARLAAQASAILGEGKGSKAAFADGRQFYQSLLQQQSGAGAVLPPVGATYGTTIFEQAGATVTQLPLDEVRAGDVVLCYAAEFSGRKGGIAPYHLSLGATGQGPAVAVVLGEWEADKKRRKIKATTVLPANSAKKRTSNVNAPSAGAAPEEVSLKLDDLKSGVIKVVRPVPKEGWIEEWA